MTVYEACFWLCVACVGYTYVAYPLLLAVVARLPWNRRPARAPFRGTVSLILTAWNEEAAVARRIGALQDHLKRTGLEGEIIVVSDGSTDGTVRAARSVAGDNVRVVELLHNVGKAAALDRAGALAGGDVLVFADTRQTWEPDALGMLLENFADPAVGAASGDLVVTTQPGVMAGVGFYWHFEKWLRRQEARVHSSVGVTGAICAVRRALFPRIPAGTLLDDVFWPLTVVMRGYRVIHDGRAVAHDRLPDRARDEFRRKIRTLSGNFQLLTLLPAAFLPWRNPVWIQFLSHKMLRLVVPWLLLALLALSALCDGPLYRLAFWGQAAFYLAGLTGLWQHVGRRVRPAGLVASFLVLNTAAWAAFWVWSTGRSSRTWTKVTYQPTGMARPAEKVAV